MSERSGAGVPAREPDRTWSYLGILILEAVVIAGLWAFGAYFSA